MFLTLLLGRPVNIAISPDGQTAIAGTATRANVFLLRITGPGQVERGNPFYRTGLPGTQSIYDDPTLHGECSHGATQSLVFSADGQRAYLLHNRLYNFIDEECNIDDVDPVLPNSLSWLRITGPGSASVGGAGVADLLLGGTSQFFGVDVIDVTRDGRWALTSNPTSSGGNPDISLVDLTTFSASTISINGCVPVGLAVMRMSEIQVPVFTPLGLGAMLALFGSLGILRLRKKR